MSATNDMMKDVVLAFAPALKSAGYRKQGARFRHDASPSVVRLVNIQSSQWNVGSEGEFTVNLGVYHRDLATLHDAMPVVEAPLVQHCRQTANWVLDPGRKGLLVVNHSKDGFDSARQGSRGDLG